MKTILLCTVMLVGGVAQAAPLDEAKAAFAQGKVAFEKGDWNTALEQFMRANQLAPAPSLSYNIGKTYEKMGRNRDAVIWFEKYLELAGPPKDEDDRKFQDELRGRIATDKAAPDHAPAPAPPPPPVGQPPQAQPPPPPQANPYYYQQPYYANPNPNPNPYGYQYNPYQPVQLTRDQRLINAKRKRSSGLSSLIAGSVLTVLGATLIGTSCAITEGCSNFGVGDGTAGITAGVLLAFAVPSIIVGPILIGVGAANFAKYSNEVKAIEREPQMQPGQPRAMIFSLPTVTF